MSYEVFQIMNQDGLAPSQNPSARVVVRTAFPVEGQPDFDARFLLNCQGPEDKFVIFTSTENQEFFIKRVHALQSSTIRSIIEATPRNHEWNCIEKLIFPTVSSRLMLHVCQYLIYKATFTGSQALFPAYPVEPDLAVELYRVTQYLNV